MASTLDTEQDDMSSLFEGMELFTPFQITEEEAKEEDDTTTTVNFHQDAPPRSRSPSPSPPPSSSAASSSSTTIPSTSEPLDENLFSDLTLTLNQESDSPPTLKSTITSTIATAAVAPEISPLSRQVSRRKKRPGIKIGYGRDTSFQDEPPPSAASPTVSVSVPTTIESSPSPTVDSEISIPLATESKSDLGVDDSKMITPAQAIEVESEMTRESCLNEDDLEIHVVTEPTTSTSDLSTSVTEEVTESECDSIEEKLVQIRNRIREKIEGIRVMVSSASAARKESAKKRRKAAENVSLSIVKYKQLEKELEEACETEDFEKADRLSENLLMVEKEKEGFLNALRDAEADCDADDLKMQEVLELQIAAEEEGVSLLEQFAKDAEDNADLVLNNAEELSSKEMGEWFSSVETLEMKKMELEIESDLVKDARSGLNESIEHLVEDDNREKELLCKKRDVLAVELEKLLALVRQKEIEIAENDSNIHEVEKRIADVVSGFHETQSSIDMKYHNMQSLLSKMELESESLSVKKKEVDDHHSQEEKRGALLRELGNASLAEAKACKELVALKRSLALPIMKSREDKVRLAKSEEKIMEDIQILKQEVTAARTTLQELSSMRSSIQQEITSLKQQVLFIDKRIPELEAEKKVAAAARNFKEAGRIAAEAKTLNGEKESIQIKLEESTLELEKMEKEINDTIKRLHESEELILSKEKDAAMTGCERLHLVAAAAMAERSAAIELGDLEEANALAAEAEAAKSQAAKLQEAYNLEEEFESMAKDLISMVLITNLGGDRLAELASPVALSTP